MKLPRRLCKKAYAIVLLSLGFSILFFSPSIAQNNEGDATEVYLDFRHRGIINSMVIAYYKNDEFYLPVSELFSLFNIDHTTDGLSVQGRFGTEQIPYHINLGANRVRFGDNQYTVTADDFLVTELDNYLRADLFYDIFGLDFTINFNNLSLNLETQRELPVIQQTLRRQRRQVVSNNAFSREKYDLRYGRERPFLDGGFLDYNLSSNISSSQNVYNFNTNVGLQLYGGDLQGSVFGSYSDAFGNLGTNNLRWRYMYRDTPWITKFIAGQTTTDGINRDQYTGIRISNEPIEPRQLFDEFEIHGNTIPQSEVELYLNNSLIDYQQADETGEYRFVTPITYGSSRLNLRIYGPTGQIIERAQRIQIPFDFQPEGVFNYNLNAGWLDAPVLGNTQQSYTLQGNGSYGLTDWLTAKAGVEYYQHYHNDLPTFTGTLSSRILSNYIVTAEAASDVYYRTTLNAIYPNSASINVDYTNFITPNTGFNVYNPSNEDKRLTASIFYPFTVFDTPLNLRASTFTRIRNDVSTSTIRLDATSRIRKFNLRIGLSDRQVDQLNPLEPTSGAYLESSLTYNLARNRNIPAYLRGAFLRGAMKYRPESKELESVDLLISQNIFQAGRLQLAAGRNFRGDFNTIRFSLVIDFDNIRTSSTFSYLRENSNFTQNIRGSVGFDSHHNQFIFTSRNQVGRSATATRLFVDSNENGRFDEGSDQSITANAIRVRRSGASSLIKNGVLYHTQMQPYYYYNMEMNKGAIQNPMLVPEFEKFGLITDPNRFKKIEVPFYMSGVIEGTVLRQYNDGSKRGIGGLKLLLNQTNGTYEEEIRTFSDGSYYAYEIPPGQYNLTVAADNLERLQARAEPDTLSFKVQSLAEGDFLNELDILLVPANQKKAESSETTGGPSPAPKPAAQIQYVQQQGVAAHSLEKGVCRYSIQLGAFASLEAAENILQPYQTDSTAYIFYNQPRKLYTVRIGSYDALHEAAKTAQNMEETAVANRCRTEDEDLAFEDYNRSRYDIQFAAMSNENKAQSYLQELEENFQLNLHLFRDADSHLHKIRLGPFKDQEKARQKMIELESQTGMPDLYLVHSQKEAIMLNVDFSFSLQIGTFDTIESTVEYAKKFENTFDYPTQIVLDENGNILLLTKDTFSDWAEIKYLHAQILEHEEFQSPVLHLLERPID